MNSAARPVPSQAPGKPPRAASPRVKADGRALLSDIYLFQVASQKSHWLSARQTAVAENVANASTPGYRALDALPFSPY